MNQPDASGSPPTDPPAGSHHPPAASASLHQRRIALSRGTLLLAITRIMTMVMENAAASAYGNPIPHGVLQLNRLRRLLLVDRFFDPTYDPAELRPRVRRGRILFADLIVLLARLLRVALGLGPPSPEHAVERAEVRNLCLDEPFFDRLRVDPARPFVGEEAEDEGCEV